MDATLSRLEEDKAIAVGDAENLTAQWAQELKNLPFTNYDPEVLGYRPRVIVPVGICHSSPCLRSQIG